MRKLNRILIAVAMAALAPLAIAQMGMGMGMGGGIDFAATDTNGDGKLSKEELAAAVPEGVLDTLFSRWDANEDGVVDEDEYKNRGGGMGG